MEVAPASRAPLLAANNAAGAAHVPKKQEEAPWWKGLLIFGGIWGCYFCVGLAHEQIYAIGNRGDKAAGIPKDMFEYANFLVFGVSVGSALMAALILLAQGQGLTTALYQEAQAPVGKHGPKLALKPSATLNKALVMSFFMVAFTYVGAMVTSNYALTKVNYPTQVLVKCAKCIPVILGGLVFFGKTYPWYDYATTFLVTISLIVFNLYAPPKGKGHGHGHGAAKEVEVKPDATEAGTTTTTTTTAVDPAVKAAQEAQLARDTMIGLALCFASLLCDGFTGPRQDEINSKYVVGSFEHMLWTNVCGAIVSLFFFVVLEGGAAVAFCAKFPDVYKLIAVYCGCSIAGQVFIFQGLTFFGALYLSIITTTRKFGTVFISIILFGHPTSTIQWLAIALMLGTLVGQSVLSHQDKMKAKAAKAAHDSKGQV